MFAFGLLEALVRVGMPFIFKGGSSLLLLLDHPQRLSTDIDIIVEPDVDVHEFIAKASIIFPFKRYTEQVRTGRNNIVKRHFKFYYDSPLLNREFHIILDILYEKNNYSSLVRRKIQNEFLIVDNDQEYCTIIPTANCILGDKMTAFAPHTTGIPINAQKDLEIMKHFFDIATLIEIMDDFSEVKATFNSIVMQEIGYRGLNLTGKDVLKDTIRAAICIIGNGMFDPAEFPIFMQGTKAVSNHIFSEKYSGEKAALQACKIICFSACVLTDQNEMIKINRYEEYLNIKLSSKQYAKLSYIRKLNLESYAYLVEGFRLLYDYDIFFS